MEITYMSDITLEQALICYRSLVPWVLDKRDLSIINSVRRSTPTSEATKIDAIMSEKLWRAAQR